MGSYGVIDCDCVFVKAHQTNRGQCKWSRGPRSCLILVRGRTLRRVGPTLMQMERRGTHFIGGGERSTTPMIMPVVIGYSRHPQTFARRSGALCVKTRSSVNDIQMIVPQRYSKILRDRTETPRPWPWLSQTFVSVFPTNAKFEWAAGSHALIPKRNVLKYA